MDEVTPPTRPIDDDPQSWDAGLDPREIIRILLKHRWTIVLALVLAGAGAFLYNWKQPRIFRATATLRIDLMSRNAMGEVWQYFVPSPGRNVNPDFYETHLKMLNSLHVAEALLDEMPPEVVKRLGHHPARTLRSIVTVQDVKDTRLFLILADHTDLDFAKTVAQSYARGYVRLNLQNSMTSVDRAAEWLTEQLADSRQKVEAAELALFEFKQKHRITTSSLDDRQGLLTSTILQQNQMVAEAEAGRLRLEARVQQLRELRDGGDVDALALALDDASIEGLKAQFYELAREKGQLLQRYKAKHPEVLEAAANMERIRADMVAEVGHRLKSLEARYEASRRAELKLTRSLDGSKRESMDLARHEIEFNRLLREAENTREIHQLLLKRTKENRLSDVQFDNNVQIVGSVIGEQEPILPRTKSNVLLGLLLGLFGGVGLAFVFNSMDNRLYTREDIERRCGATYLGIFPTLRVEGGRKLWNEPQPFVVDHPRSSASECGRILRTNLLFGLGDAEPGRGRCVLVTGSEPRSGKTTVTSNLAVMLAEQDRRVLLVDGDLRHPSVRHAFGLSRSAGIGDLTKPETEFDTLPRPTGIPKLDLVPAGKVPDNPAPLLESDRFVAFLEWARANYDFVLIDGPPLLVVADALLVVPRVDGVLLVGRSGYTKIGALVMARRQLEEIDSRLIGVVVNSVDMRRRENRYYYYYYHKYGDYYLRLKRDSSTTQESRPSPPPDQPSASV